jgi:hypothetical protein
MPIKDAQFAISCENYNGPCFGNESATLGTEFDTVRNNADENDAEYGVRCWYCRENDAVYEIPREDFLEDQEDTSE